MPDQTPVPIPPGVTPTESPATVPVPEGVTPQAGDALAAAGQATKLSNEPEGPIDRALDAVWDTAGGVVTGAGKALLKTLGGASTLAGEALNRIPGVGETLAPRAGLEAEKQGLQEATAPNPDLPSAAQKVGGALEEGAEWMGGDALLKALGKLPLIAKNAPEILKLAEKYPKVTKILTGAVLGGTQAGTKAPAEGKDALESAESGAVGGAVGSAIPELAGAAAESKTGRSLINRSAGAAARDVTYGNPAKALLDENIKVPTTGDAEIYKDALRQGKTPAEASHLAGGRIAAVTDKINELEPQLTALLKSSPARISVKDTILTPIYDATREIMNNRAMTEPEKDAATDKLLELQKSLIDGLGKNISPEVANSIKQQLGDRVNWTGTAAVGDEVKPVYRRLYGSLKNAVHTAVPEAAELDERMSNLLAARNTLVPLSKKEEVGMGKGVTSGNFWDVPQRLLNELGRMLPAVNAAAKSPVTRAAFGVGGEETGLGALPPAEAGMVRFRSSDGAIHDVPLEQLPKAKEIDPDLQVIQQ